MAQTDDRTVQSDECSSPESRVARTSGDPEFISVKTENDSDTDDCNAISSFDISSCLDVQIKQEPPDGAGDYANGNSSVVLLKAEKPDDDAVVNGLAFLPGIENACKWTHNMIMLLLKKRLSMEDRFNKPSCLKKKLWHQVANYMRAKNYELSGGMCDSKFRNLLATYKKNKRKQLQNDQIVITWEYFETMDACLGNKVIRAPEECAAATERVSTTDETVPELSPPRKKKKDVIAEYFRLKLKVLREEHERKNERWRQKMEIKRQEIEAINNLAAAIANKHNRK